MCKVTNLVRHASQEETTQLTQSPAPQNDEVGTTCLSRSNDGRGGVSGLDNGLDRLYPDSASSLGGALGDARRGTLQETLFG